MSVGGSSTERWRRHPAHAGGDVPTRDLHGRGWVEMFPRPRGDDPHLCSRMPSTLAPRITGCRQSSSRVRPTRTSAPDAHWCGHQAGAGEHGPESHIADLLPERARPRRRDHGDGYGGGREGATGLRLGGDAGDRGQSGVREAYSANCVQRARGGLAHRQAAMAGDEQRAKLIGFSEDGARSRPPVFVGRHEAISDILRAADRVYERWLENPRKPQRHAMTRLIQGGPRRGQVHAA